MSADFNLTVDQRRELTEAVFEAMEQFYGATRDLPVSPDLDVATIRNLVDGHDMATAADPAEVVDEVVRGLSEYAVHTPHQRYFGLFNPRPNFPSILADLLAAAFNPQLAAWSHAPFAAEVEARVVRELGVKFGYQADTVDGVFATGGAEANLTAVLCALTDAFAGIHQSGIQGLNARPLIYCSAEAHHSIARAARVVGLGQESVVAVESDPQQRLDAAGLTSRLAQDRQQSGVVPLMIVGTAGTTGAGIIDPLDVIADIAREHGLWFHADAAYGGGALLCESLRSHFSGIERADSITFDAHKWMSVPMAGSLFLTSRPEILSRTFALDTAYMPKEAATLPIVDPFSHSIQWSRRFIGLKVYMSLRVFGWSGYDEVISHQTRMGDRLRELLQTTDWTIENDTPLPVVCFTSAEFRSADFVQHVTRGVLASGEAWLSTYPSGDLLTLRACITNFDTQEEDLQRLVGAVNHQRDLWRTEGTSS